MGMMLMPDEELVVKLILDRIDKSDEQTKDAIKELKSDIGALADQHERDKEGAIKRGTEQHEETKAEIKATQTEVRKAQETMTLTGGRVAVLEKTMDEEVKPVVTWFHDEGSKLGGRVSTLEQAEVARNLERQQAETARAGAEGEKRGKVWALRIAWTLLTAAAAAIITYGRDFLDLIAAKGGN